VTPDLPPLSVGDSRQLARRRRARNWALLVVLLALVVLFYAMTIVKLAKA
jgi:hypothetical protein